MNTKNLWLAGTHKLNHRLFGPFVVTAHMGHVAYKLDLPAAFSVLFPIFHVLKLCASWNNGGDSGTEAVHPVLRDGYEEFEVDCIVGQYGYGEKLQLRVCWWDYGIANGSLLSETTLINAPSVL